MLTAYSKLAVEHEVIGMEKGMEKGMEVGMSESIKVIKLHLQGKTPEEIASAVNIAVERVLRILRDWDSK